MAIPDTAGLTADTSTNFVKETLAEIQEAYLSDARPWVIGYSGGKDSTTLLQLVYYMLARLPMEKRVKSVYVVASDTRVEAPSISSRVCREMELVQAAAARDKIPLTTQMVYPLINDTFWVNLIGRGYPSPNRWFRWCTDRLKIRPVSRFIKSVVDRSGSVVVVLGARKAESATRAQTMASHQINGQRFRPHMDLPKAWVYTPIEDLMDEQVWVYLLQVPSPWGGDNRGLVTLYRRASGGECPLVIDTSTPSCGHSRFGCWTCTVIDKDHSMESLVDAGEERYEPLLELRDYLKWARDQTETLREPERKNGVKEPGPFTMEARIDILRRVFEAQRKSGMVLIEGDEMVAIQEIWSKDENQPVDLVEQIWKHVFEEANMPDKYNSYDHLSKEDELLRRACEQHNIPFEMLRRLREIEEEYGTLKRRHGLPEQMRDAIRQHLDKE